MQMGEWEHPGRGNKTCKCPETRCAWHVQVTGICGAPAMHHPGIARIEQ